MGNSQAAPAPTPGDKSKIMPVDYAPTGRASCQGCFRSIGKGALRIGRRVSEADVHVITAVSKQLGSHHVVGCVRNWILVALTGCCHFTVILFRTFRTHLLSYLP